MQRIEFTSKKQCPYCDNFNVEYIDLSDLLGTTHQDVIRIHTNKYVFKCNVWIWVTSILLERSFA
jgi:predicted nucleic-acid-binding Zn-ribbon protein